MKKTAADVTRSRGFGIPPRSAAAGGGVKPPLHFVSTRESEDFAMQDRQRWLRRMQRPYIVEREWRRSVRQIRDAAWSRSAGLDLREARLFGLGVFLLALAAAGAAWLFSLLGWIR